MSPALSTVDAVCAEVRDRPSADEGDFVLVFVDSTGAVLLVLDVDEGTRYPDELFYRYVASVVRDLALPAVYLCVPRRTGRPARVDRRMWREIEALLLAGPTTPVDLLVVGEERCWSAQSTTRSAAA